MQDIQIVFGHFLPTPKGQLISKAIYGLLTSPKKRTDEFVLFAFLLFTANKSNSSVRFLGESTARQSAFRFYLTFNKDTVKLGDKERFDKEQIGVKEPFPVTNLPIYFIRIRNIWR